MYTDLITRIDAQSFFGMSRSTFQTYARHYADFPPVRGVKNRLHTYSRAELMAFFEIHAPKFAAKGKANAEVSA